MISWIPMLALAVVSGQDSGATVTGVVRDARSGEPVAGAMVALSDLGRATTSGEFGRYLLRGVPAGLQHLEVQRIGYAPRALNAVLPGELIPYGPPIPLTTPFASCQAGNR